MSRKWAGSGQEVVPEVVISGLEVDESGQKWTRCRPEVGRKYAGNEPEVGWKLAGSGMELYMKLTGSGLEMDWKQF